MKESELTTQFKNDLSSYCKNRNIPFFWHKLDDFPANSIAVALRKMLCPRCQPMVGKTGLGRFQSRKRPFDAVSLVGGAPVAIEFKMHNSETAVPLSTVKDYQEAGLRDFSTGGGIGLILFGNVFEPKDPKKYDDIFRYRNRVYRLIGIEWDRWRELRLEIGAKRKSVPLAVLLERALMILARVEVDGARSWDVRTFTLALRQFGKEA